MVILSIEYQQYVEGKECYEHCSGCADIIGREDFIAVMYRFKDEVMVFRYHADCIELIGLSKRVT